VPSVAVELRGLFIFGVVSTLPALGGLGPAKASSAGFGLGDLVTSEAPLFGLRLRGL
jgi:hypothetical protein